MTTVTTKARAYLAIDSFEQDVRQCIERFLLDHLDPSQVFTAEHDELVQRQAREDDADQAPLTHYLFLRQGYDVLLRHVAVLPSDLGELLRTNLPTLDPFVSVRNRVMHGRPLRPDDLEKTEAFVARFRSRYFAQTTAALSQLESDLGWQPEDRVTAAPTDRVLHNLPAADFDETGLLGRESLVAEVSDLVKRRRDRMITLTGEGGIGKTALALEVCYRLVDELEPEFDAILWTSLKNERLTADGVQQISNSIRDVAGAAQHLGRAIDADFKGSIEALGQALEGIRALVVVDNLETAQGSEVLALYDALPDATTFLFTSRVGIGQIERRVPIGPLDEASGMLLFRKFARSRRQASLNSLANETVMEVVDRLRYSPLAIRWYILSVESGKTPLDTLRNQADLLAFCVANVYDSLGFAERNLLGVLRTIDRSASFDELAVISDMAIDDLRRAAQRLSQGSLIVRNPTKNIDESEFLALSSTARAFLPPISKMEGMEDVIRRETEYNRDRERSRIKSRKRYLDVNVIFERSDNDAPTAYLLRLALKQEKAGDSAAADGTLDRARTLNPGYFEVDRVDAFFASKRREHGRATTLYRSAVSQCATSEERAWVNYFFAGHLARGLHDLPAAIELAEEAHSEFASCDTALQLGGFLVWDHRFEQGQELIKESLSDPPSATFTRIATTALVDSWRRWSEADFEGGLYLSAVQRALVGVEIGLQLVDSGSSDRRLLNAVVESVSSALRAAKVAVPIEEDLVRELAIAIERVKSDSRFWTTQAWTIFAARVGDPVAPVGHRTGGSRAANYQETSTSSYGESLRMRGYVVQYREKYGFIAHPDYPANLFFHLGLVSDPETLRALRVGLAVEFTHQVNERGQDQAVDVVAVS